MVGGHTDKYANSHAHTEPITDNIILDPDHTKTPLYLVLLQCMLLQHGTTKPLSYKIVQLPSQQTSNRECILRPLCMLA